MAKKQKTEYFKLNTFEAHFGFSQPESIPLSQTKEYRKNLKNRTIQFEGKNISVESYLDRFQL